MVFDPKPGYNEFEEKFIIAWAQTNLEAFIRQNPDSTMLERGEKYVSFVESGMNLLLKLVDLK